MTLLLLGAGKQTVAGGGGDPIGDALRAAALAYYTFESDGTDLTGRGNDAVNHSGEITTGKIGNALKATSAGNGYMEAPDSNDLRLINTRYFALWFKMYANASIYFFAKDSNGGDVEYIFTYSSLNELLRWYFNAGGADLNFTADTDWHYLECYYKTDGNEAGIAIDNGVFTTSNVITVANIVDGLQIGALGGFTGDTDIDIDEFYISSAIPDQDGRDYLYNSGAGRTLYP